MKKFIIFAIIGVFGGGFLSLGLPFQTIFALYFRDLEIIFLVVDAQTGDPVPGATVSLREDWIEPGIKPKAEKVVTDYAGRAIFHRNFVKSEDIIRPYRRTIQTFDLTWDIYGVSAEGYATVQDQWLEASKYEN